MDRIVHFGYERAEDWLQFPQMDSLIIMQGAGRASKESVRPAFSEELGN